MSDVRGLGTDEIDEYLRSSSKFEGEYSLIINADNPSLPGSHWTALVVRGDNVIILIVLGDYIILAHFQQMILLVKFALLRRLCFIN